ncbi:hypothetical protein FOPE_10618 [Fonsecaea pedrosoi]|nr:hypothetical protein FOPE_10618 [Fonsecaea pedrosoi]
MASWSWSWFQLPPEIRNRVYEFAYGTLVFKPLQRPDSTTQMRMQMNESTPSPAFSSLAVCRQWNTEVTPYLLPRATFDFTGHPGDPPPPQMVSPKTYEAMRHVVILESHCFNSDWLDQVFAKMVQVRTMTIRKMGRTRPGNNNDSVFDGPGLTQEFLDKVKLDPIKTLLTGYRFDHLYIKEMLKAGRCERRILLEGSLWLRLAANADSTIHSNYTIDLESWKVRIEGVLEGAVTISDIQAQEPAPPVGPVYFEDEEGMFEYLFRQHWASSRHSKS